MGDTSPMNRAIVAISKQLLLDLVALSVLWFNCTTVTADETALDRYVLKPDSSFAWKLSDTIPACGYTTYVIDLTSQTWRAESEVDRPTWKHWLTIVRPEAARSGKA